MDRSNSGYMISMMRMSNGRGISSSIYIASQACIVVESRKVRKVGKFELLRCPPVNISKECLVFCP